MHAYRVCMRAVEHAYIQTYTHMCRAATSSGLKLSRQLLQKNPNPKTLVLQLISEALISLQRTPASFPLQIQSLSLRGIKCIKWELRISRSADSPNANNTQHINFGQTGRCLLK